MLLLITTVIFNRYCIAQKLDNILPVSRKTAVKIFPNPVKNKATLRLSNFDAGMVHIQILDIKGTIMYNQNRLVVSKEDDVTVFFQFPTGRYWCIVKQKERTAKVTFSIVL